jgi:hypothetical protein
MPAHYQDLIVTIEGQVGTIKFNRPKQLNSLSPTLIRSWIQALSDLAENKETIVTVVTAEGRYFSAGVDVNSAGSTNPKPETTTDAMKLLDVMEGNSWIDSIGGLLIKHPKPLIFALQGPVVGITAAWVGCLSKKEGEPWKKCLTLVVCLPLANRPRSLISSSLPTRRPSTFLSRRSVWFLRAVRLTLTF